MAVAAVTAAEAFQRARQHGVEMIPNGRRLRLRAPQKPPQDVLEALRAHKFELLEWLSRRDARAIVTYRLTEAPHLWPIVVGAAGECVDDVIDGLRRRYGDRLLEARAVGRRYPRNAVMLSTESNCADRQTTPDTR